MPRNNIKASLGASYSLPLSFPSNQPLYFNTRTYILFQFRSYHSQATMQPVPPAPQLPHLALQEIFTYPDPNRPLDPNNKFSNALRLEFFGSKIALAVYTDVVRELWPGATTAQLKASALPI